jgi:hypothetical protein
MIKFQKEHQTRWAHATIDNVFQIGESTWRLRFRRECNEIQLPDTGFQRRDNFLEWL